MRFRVARFAGLVTRAGRLRVLSLLGGVESTRNLEYRIDKSLGRLAVIR